MTHRVQINYRSGHSMVVTTSGIETNKYEGRITAINWADDTVPRPLVAGVAEIESVWRLPDEDGGVG
ncbi:hypothetical protein FK268_09360 [Tsukamurella sputi]|uniref:Uncharacterized protein n=1 Tax=Tsukamurella sputi TaxID=2591848 RepID=A0A5C5RS47_9ACTN|nr:hypothetical protein [Tsukamurella sputi]TWS25388.1 hypothetical protein FK268_09360 [Tsukamurella sputi]